MDKKLYRSTENKMLGGVCAGIAEYFDIDPTLIRLIFVLIFFAEGAGFLAYIVAWIIIPEKPVSNQENGGSDKNSSSGSHEIVENEEIEKQSENAVHKKSSSQNIWGILMIIIGGLFLINTWISFIFMERFWPLLLIVIGLVLLLKSNKGET